MAAEAAIAVDGVVAARAFGDTAVLVSERAGRRLVLVDWRTQRATQVGRLGEGPGEYSAPGYLVPAGGDTTIHTDLVSGRWTWYVAGRHIFSMAVADVVPRLLGKRVAGYATGGHVLSTTGFSTPKAGERRSFPTFPEFADSQLVMLAAPRSPRVDTVARIGGGYRGPSSERVRSIGGLNVTHILRSALATFDQATRTSEGWVALLRLDPFRIQWVDPAGMRRGELRLPDRRVVVDAKERAYVLERLQFDGALPWSADDYPNWPRFIPGALPGALLPMPDGRVAVALTPSAMDRQSRYVVVDRSAGMVAALEFAEHERVVAFGRKAAFVVRRDSDGQEWLVRRRLP